MSRTYNSYKMSESSFARIYQEYLSSGLTKNEYCLRMGYGRTSFYYWEKKWGKKLSVCGQKEILIADPTQLVPINIIPEQASPILVSSQSSKSRSTSCKNSSKIEISLPSGVQIRFSGDIRAELLMSILNKL